MTVEINHNAVRTLWEGLNRHKEFRRVLYLPYVDGYVMLLVTDADGVTMNSIRDTDICNHCLPGKYNHDVPLEYRRTVQGVEIYCENFYDSWATLWKYDNNNFPVLEANDPAPIFRECLSKNCFTLHGNYLYRCNLMYGLKMLQEQYRWHPKIRAMETIGGIAHWKTPEQIAEYLTSEKCFYSACSYCTPNCQLKIEQCQQLY